MADYVEGYQSGCSDINGRCAANVSRAYWQSRQIRAATSGILMKGIFQKFCALYVLW